MTSNALVLDDSDAVKATVSASSLESHSICSGAGAIFAETFTQTNGIVMIANSLAEHGGAVQLKRF